MKRFKISRKNAVLVWNRIRLGVFDVTDPLRPVEYAGRVFGAGEFDQRVMRRAIAGYNRASARVRGCSLAMAAFPVRS